MSFSTKITYRLPLFCGLLFTAFIQLCSREGFAVDTYSQNDSLKTYELKQADIIDNRNPAAMSGTKAHVIDTLILKAYSQQNLADLLAQQSSVFIKSYGPGMLATSSFRGAGAAHTMVLWNGFNLQSPTHGQLDLSLIPVAFLDNITIQYGGSGSRYGSGAMGGAVVLNNKVAYGRGFTIKVGAGVGSFGLHNEQLSIVHSGKRFVTSLKGFMENAHNNFQYQNPNIIGNPTTRQKNNQLSQRGFLQENHLRINDRNTLSLRLWYQYANRQVPPTMLETYTDASQQDRSLRIASEWKHTENTISYATRASYINEMLYYQYPYYSFDSKSNAQSYVAETEANKSFTNRHFVTLGANNTFSSAVLKYYSENPKRNVFAVFGTYRFTALANKLNLQSSVRQEWLNGKTLPTIPALGIEYNIFKRIALKAALSKIYRIPTFNDLYWAAGGNPNLKPENGWSREVGAKYSNSKGFHAESIEFTYFNRDITDWILWQPTNFGYWTPTNVLKVNSSGTELNLKSDIAIRRFTLRFSALNNYVLSVNRRAKSATDEGLGKQLIYVPIYTTQANVGIQYQSLFVNYTFNYTGYRYTSADNYEYLTPYRLGGLQVSYSKTIGEYELSFNAQFQNLWGEIYQSVAQRPQPLFNYRFGLILKYNNSKTNDHEKFYK